MPSPCDLTDLRARHPEAIAEAAARRARRPLLGERGSLLIVAADHTARGILGVSGRPLAMANRIDLLERLLVVLSRPEVDGVLGTADVLEDLLLLGALEGKIAVGSMNRGGLAGAAFELDDRFTGYHADQLDRMRFDAGKLLLRIDPASTGSLETLEASARAVDALAARGLTAMVEPFMAVREDERVRNLLDPASAMRALTIASGLGATSARTWLKVPVVDDMERVMQACTLPALLLGGDVSSDPGATYARWGKALALPQVKGLVVGRSLLYPHDDDVAGAVDAAVALL